MAVSIQEKSHPERGTYYEIDLSAGGDAVQAHLVRVPGKPSVNWFNGDVSWYKSHANTGVSFTNGPPEDMAINPATLQGVATGSWKAHARTAEFQDWEQAPLTGLRWKAATAPAKVILWTRNPLRPGSVSEVKSV